MPEHAYVCTQSSTVGGSMHIVCLLYVSSHKEEEKATGHFFQANIMDKAEEYVSKYK